MNDNIMITLFQLFEKEGISYLHFKSNTNLNLSFQNRADFDVLIDKSRIIDVERIISKCNGKRHNPVHIGYYPSVDNWLIFDENSGCVYHLHLHYQLVTGKSLVKDYVLPWNDLLFKTRIKDSEFGTYITDPSLELVLLATRSVLKAKPKDYLKKLFGAYSLSNSMKREWEDLKQKASQERLIKYIEELYPINHQRMVQYLIKERMSQGDYRGMHRVVRQEMANYRRYGSLEASIRSRIYKIEDLIKKVRSRKAGGVAITKKISLQGGLIIAFVGVDGAGKSTVSNEISKWIGKKIECTRFYMGMGDGKTTVFASTMKRMKKTVSHENKPKAMEKNYEDVPVKGRKPITFIKNPKQYIKQYLKMCMICSVEKNNVKKIKKMYRYKLNGGISVLDRFPQIEIVGQNDGPKMPPYIQVFGERNFVKKRIEKERRWLDIVNVIKPDMVFRLNISVDTCINRKPEHNDREMFARKINELNKLHFQGAKIIDIDAELPYDLELLEIKKQLWKYV